MFRTLLFVLVCSIIMGQGGPARGAAPELPADALEGVIVQDFGFEKSLLSFARERLALLGRGADLPDQHPILTVLGMILEPASWRARPLFRIEHPALLEVFDRQRLISANDFMNGEKMERLRDLIHRQPKVEPAIADLERRVKGLLDIGSQLAIVPRAGQEWVSPFDKLTAAQPSAVRQSHEQAITAAFAQLSRAYLGNDREAFAKAAGELVERNRQAAQEANVGLGRVKVDLLNTRFQPFRWSAALYLLATFVYVIALGSRGRRPATAAVVLLAAGFAAHAAGLVFRTILVGRAPVSNMFESLVFAIAGMTAIAVVLDRVYKNPLIGLAGALLGFLFMVIAIKMPLHQSRINPLRPALQSSWLTYHVITIMLSYSAFALSFFVSMAYLLKRAVGGDQPRVPGLRLFPSLESLDFYNYRIISVGFPLLTVGIFTGAVWAATAWGRPWAFDPKETWSAITWLVYGVFLHTRLLSGWKGTRSAVVGVIGFAAVLFTYIGVNYLLPGLHSYV